MVIYTELVVTSFRKIIYFSDDGVVLDSLFLKYNHVTLDWEEAGKPKSKVLGNITDAKIKKYVDYNENMTIIGIRFYEWDKFNMLWRNITKYVRQNLRHEFGLVE